MAAHARYVLAAGWRLICAVLRACHGCAIAGPILLAMQPIGAPNALIVNGSLIGLTRLVWRHHLTGRIKSKQRLSWCWRFAAMVISGRQIIRAMRHKSQQSLRKSQPCHRQLIWLPNRVYLVRYNWKFRSDFCRDREYRLTKAGHLRRFYEPAHRQFRCRDRQDAFANRQVAALWWNIDQHCLLPDFWHAE